MRVQLYDFERLPGPLAASIKEREA